MGTFYRNEPPAHVGGKQPYEGRKSSPALLITPAVAVGDNPPGVGVPKIVEIPDWTIPQRAPRIAPLAAGPSTTLTPALFANLQAYDTHIISAGAVTLAPALFVNTQAYDTHLISATYTLSPNLFVNTQAYDTHVISAGGIALAPGLFENLQAYDTHLITTTYTLSPALFANAQAYDTHVISVAGGAQSLTPDLFANLQAYDTHVISGGAADNPPGVGVPKIVEIPDAAIQQRRRHIAPFIVAAQVDNPPFRRYRPPVWSWGEDVIVPLRGAGLIQSVDRPIYKPAWFQTVYLSWVPPNPSQQLPVHVAPIIPAAVDNPPGAISFEIVYLPYPALPQRAPQIAPLLGAVQTLIPALYVNLQAYDTHLIVGGAVTLNPALYVNTQAYDTHLLTTGVVTLTPALYVNAQAYDTHLITTTVTLSPALYVNLQAYDTHAITQTGGAQTLTPQLFLNAQAYDTHLLTTGVVTLTPATYVNLQAYDTHLITTRYTLTAPLLVNVQAYDTHSLTVTYTLSPPHFIDPDEFDTHALTGGVTILSPSLFVDPDEFDTHLITGGDRGPPIGPGGPGPYLTRERWRRMCREWEEAARAAERKAQQVTGKRRVALKAAAKAAEEATLVCAELEVPVTVDGDKLTRLLEAAVAAKGLSETVVAANAARDYALRIAEEMEEEEAIALLLMQ